MASELPASPTRQRNGPDSTNCSAFLRANRKFGAFPPEQLTLNQRVSPEPRLPYFDASRSRGALIRRCR